MTPPIATNRADLALVHPSQFLTHRSPSGAHPESPERLLPLLDWLERSDALSGARRITPSPAGETDLRRVHAEEMLRGLAATRGRSGWIDPDTYFVEESYDQALRAAGATIELATRIWKKEFRRGFSLVRPPGHHATKERAMGFCLLNNVALAATAVLAEAPQARLAIVDFDLHHGNGTQEIFYRNPNVLFVSSHRYPYYPGTGGLLEIGAEAGEGTKINFPLDGAYGHEFFVGLYDSIVFPVLSAYRPDMILVSAGFDGHLLDPMQGFRMTTATYRCLAEGLVAAAETHCSGRILFCLEGGYSAEALRDSGAAVLQALADLPRSPFAREGGARESAETDRFRRFFAPLFPGAL